MQPPAPRTERLGPHHFAHLRAVAEGVPVVESARHYLFIDHGQHARGAHQRVVDQVRALARRRGDSRWRLIGMEIRDTGEAAEKGARAAPSIDDWAESEGLDDWSQAELLDLYAERFGVVDPTARRRHARNARLRERRMRLLRELEASASVAAKPTDLLEGWLEPAVGAALVRSGALTLADVQARIRRGGRWWSGLPGFGPIKARRLQGLLQMLLPFEGAVAATVSDTSTLARWPALIASPQLEIFSGQAGRNRVQGAYAGTEARDDREAVQAWITARAKSDLTKKQYAREAERFILWCVLERGRALSDATAEDCSAYMAFIGNVPDAWITRNNVARLAPGWAPFKGSLSIASQQFALAALHSLFAWLVQARYLASNPWVLVNRKLGDDPRHAIGDTGSRAFTPTAWSAITKYLDSAPASPSLERLRWICTFEEATGLRAAELIQARVGDLKQLAAGWVLKVHGKGRRNRTVPVPSRAMAATVHYLRTRDIGIDADDADRRLLGSLVDGREGIAYSALYETFRRFLGRALKSLPMGQRHQALRASMHWLRHTHATRAAEANVPADVLQENLGQSDPRTTARYYRAQLERRQREMERVYGALSS